MSKKHNFNKSLLDIAILTSGRSDLFEKCIDQIMLQMDESYRIYVCNNGAPSAEYEKAYIRLPQNSIIKRLNKNIGFAGGANTVINAGNSPLILFVSDDIFLHPGAIEQLIKTMDDPTIALCGYKLLFPVDSQDATRPAGKVQHIGIATTITGEIIHPMMGWSSNNPKCCISREVLAVTGASFIVRRSAFNAVRGFPTIYGDGYYEDIDLCLNIRGKGLGKIYIDTNAQATHGVGQSFIGKNVKQMVQQNRLAFRARWVHMLPWTEIDFW